MKRSVFITTLAMLLALGAVLSGCGKAANANNAAQNAGSGETGQESSAPLLEKQTVPFKASCIRVAWREHDSWPPYYLFTDAKALENYYLAQKGGSAEDARQDISTYTDEWFKTHQLIVVPVDAGSGSVRFNVSMVTKDSIVIERQSPMVGTADMASWRIFIEVDRTFPAKDELNVEFINMPLSPEK